ncbi:MAG TPA: hypothetical protein ENN43_04955 [bacterium]|nr:hypothetical protein [bacterium]
MKRIIVVLLSLLFVFSIASVKKVMAGIDDEVEVIEYKDPTPTPTEKVKKEKKEKKDKKDKNQEGTGEVIEIIE